MPAYATSGTSSMVRNPSLPVVLYPGDDTYVFGTSYDTTKGPTPGQIQTANDDNVLFEAAALGARSVAVALAPRPGGGVPGLMVQVTANANPGAAEIDVQDAAIDADGAYQTNSSSASYKITVWTQVGAVWTAWTELQPEGGRFVSLKVIANPNIVKFTAKLSYV